MAKKNGSGKSDKAQFDKTINTAVEVAKGVAQNCPDANEVTVSYEGISVTMKRKEQSDTDGTE